MFAKIPIQFGQCDLDLPLTIRPLHVKHALNDIFITTIMITPIRGITIGRIIMWVVDTALLSGG